MTVTALSGCGHDAPRAASSIAQLRAMEIVRTPPPGADRIGGGVDKGSDSTVTGRQPGVVEVYAVHGNVSTTADYYRRAFSKYGLSPDCCASSRRVQLVGRSGWANVLVDIAAGTPVIPPHFHVHTPAASSTPTTYVTVYVSGQAPASNGG